MKNVVHMLAMAALLSTRTAAAAPAGNGPDLNSMRDELAQWVEVQKAISREREDWTVGGQVMRQRMELLQAEIAALDAKIAEAGRNMTAADAKRRALAREDEALQAASAALARVIGTLEEKTRRLVRALPDPIRERIQPLSQRLPANPAGVEQSLGVRFQTVVGVLNEVNKFQREVTVTSEVRTLPGGDTAEVKALYIGLGQAYYVTSSGEVAGIGRPTADGWEWTADNSLAARVRAAIAVLQNETVPAFISLPAEIR